MKAGQLRSWWENPATASPDDIIEDTSRSPVMSMVLHSDALWALAGSEVCGSSKTLRTLSKAYGDSVGISTFSLFVMILVG